jgi:hypothetical protein
MFHELKRGRDGKPFPEPTTDPPTVEQMEEWMFDGDVEATDGCVTDPDGFCEHGHPSWLLRMGVI